VSTSEAAQPQRRVKMRIVLRMSGDPTPVRTIENVVYFEPLESYCQYRMAGDDEEVMTIGSEYDFVEVYAE